MHFAMKHISKLLKASRVLAGMAFVFLVCNVSPATCQVAESDSLIHKVRAGDTLIKI